MQSIKVLQTIGNIETDDVDAHAIDWVEMTSEERSSPHLRIRSVHGIDVLISLERGHELEDGDILHSSDRLVVAVKAAQEDLLRVAPDTHLGWGIAANQLGNLHRPVRFQEDAMVTPYDPLVENLLQRLAIAYERVSARFVGKRYGAHTGHSH